MGLALKLAGVVSLIAGLSWIALDVGLGTEHVSAIWWSNAVLVSILLLDRGAAPAGRGRAPRADAWRSKKIVFGDSVRRWPALLAAGYAGNVAAHLLIGDPVSYSLAFSVCDAGEAALAAYAFRFACRDRVDLARQNQLLQFVGFAVILAPLLSSITAGFFLHLLAAAPFSFSLRWFPASALGMAIVPPLVLGLARRETRELFHPARLPKTLFYFLIIGAGTAAIFSRSEYVLLFLLIPPLLFLVLRLGLSGGALGCVLVAIIGTDFTVGRHGRIWSLPVGGLEHRILVLQLFLATAVLSVCLVAVVLAELRRANQKIHASELRYRSLAASMEMLATIDPLTHVANRRRFDEVLQNEWNRALRNHLPLSVVLIDADFFKAYNDTLGHLAGDECLRRIAEKMSEMARRPADLAARFGGEEFSLILPETPAEGAILRAECLRQSIESLGFHHAASPLGVVTVSGGCATVIPGPTAKAVDLLQAADMALYEAKRKGRNRVEVAPELESVARAH